MNKYAIVSVGDKQYKVVEGDKLEVQKLDISSDKSIVLDQVLLVVDGDKVEVGTPTVKDVQVYATYVEDKKGEKVQVFKYKSKSKYRKLRGARQTYSYLTIDSIGAAPKKAPVSKEVKKETAKVVKKAVKKTPAKKAAKPRT